MTARHKHCVANCQNLIDVVDSVLVLKLRHDSHIWIDAEVGPKALGFLAHHFFQLDYLLVASID